MELTKSEMQIMDVLWDAGEPLSRAQLLERSQDKCWKDSSVHILLNGLLKKAVIAPAGFVKCSKTFGRTFTPAMTREEYYAQNVFCYRRQPQALALLQAIWERPELTAEDKAAFLAQLEK